MTAAEKSPLIPAGRTLEQENEDLRSQVRELRETLDAIRSGEVDAIVVSQGETSQVFALEGADHPYRVLVENIQEGALTLTPAGTILYANAAFAAMRSLPLSAILGAALRDQFSPRDRAQLDALLAASALGPCRGEMRICSGTGSYSVKVSLTPVAMSGEAKISAVVTDRRQDYDRLRLLARMLDSVADAVTAVDPDGTIVYWNEAAERLYGWTVSEMVGRPLADSVDHGISEDEALRIADLLAAGAVWSGEHLACYRDGRRFPVQATRAPVYDEDRVLVGVIATSRDITERKQAEAALREYAGNLQRSNEDLERFAYVSSHDLQEPLRSIVSFSQLLARRYKGKLDQDADDYIGFIVEGGVRMQALIRDLLQVSRLQTTAKPPVPTDAGAVARDALALLNGQVRDLDGSVTVGPLPAVMADAAQLEQVFVNLVANAIKYRREGVPPAIAISARRLDGMVEFEVRDNGIGIEAEYYDRIFEMFRRLHTKDRYEGTGIGLAIVKRIVERHGGTVRVESTPGEGSTFFFTLPAA